MSGTTYAPSYTVDLVSLPSTTPAASAKPAPSKPGIKPKPIPEKKIPEPAEPVAPEEVQKEMQTSGGDEAARLERRRKIEELEMEARRLYESFTDEEGASTEDRVYSEETSAVGPPVTNATTGGNDTSANIRFKAYYDRIHAEIRSFWVLPEGVTSRVSLITVVRIRIAPNGEIEQFWIEERSGNDYYDQSVLRAIRKANPLPSLPDEMSDTSLEVGLNFRPRDK
jgi:colicin import membrane protein